MRHHNYKNRVEQDTWMEAASELIAEGNYEAANYLLQDRTRQEAYRAYMDALDHLALPKDIDQKRRIFSEAAKTLTQVTRGDLEEKVRR